MVSLLVNPLSCALLSTGAEHFSDFRKELASIERRADHGRDQLHGRGQPRLAQLGGYEIHDPFRAAIGIVGLHRSVNSRC